MALRLFNSRTRSQQALQPMSAGKVSLYVCGMTPSFHPHVGHARTFLTFDVLRRYLTSKGYAVTHVQNVTDIDDKIIERARVERVAWEDVAERYHAEYEHCASLLNILPPDVSPRPTQHTHEIIEMIAGLMEDKAAYETADGVYFAVDSFPGYGKLSNRQIEELRAGSRVAVREEKRDWLDFALWKKAKPDEPSWPSPWGPGRPGWHVECSALARLYLGDQFDIHGGASDLIFPHHENEVAQTEKFTGKAPMAQIWVHGGLVMVDGQKMSKSLGNFVPLTALLSRHEPAAVRFLFLQTGYHKPTNFTEESIEAATRGLRGLYSDLDGLGESQPALSGAQPVPSAELKEFETFLDDDLNTAGAIGWLQKKLKDARAGRSPTPPDGVGVFRRCLEVLGLPKSTAKLAQSRAPQALQLSDETRQRLVSITGDGTGGDDILIERAVAVRASARAAKDFAKSDNIRQILTSAGIVLKDSASGTEWKIDGA